MDNFVNHSRTYISAQSKKANSQNMLTILLAVLPFTNVNSDKDNPATSSPRAYINKKNDANGQFCELSEKINLSTSGYSEISQCNWCL